MDEHVEWLAMSERSESNGGADECIRVKRELDCDAFSLHTP